MQFIKILFVNHLSGVLILWILSTLTQFTYAQKTDGENPISDFGGAVTVTNNGISLLPSFSLREPAGILDMKVGRKLTFEPQFRFALEGRPWSFIFWWRYKLVDKGKLSLRVGAHPSVLFRTVSATINGNTGDKLIADRFVAGEVVPNYQLTENISIGMYYLKGHGFQDDNIQDSDFITLNCNFSHIQLFESLYVKFFPQLYFLRLDSMSGTYFTATTTLAMDDFPISIETIINQPFESDIVGGEDFIWNISLIYSFSNQFVKK